MSSPSVSVIINTLDRAPSLARTLSSLGQLRYPNFEVIVVRGPCTDGTDGVLALFGGRIRTAVCEQANLAMSRNIAARMAGGEILAFLDDDTIPEPDWLDHLVAGFADSGVGAVGGFIRDQRGIGFQYRTIVANRFAEVRGSADPDCPRAPGEYLSPTGANFAVRREFLLSIGGFDEEYAYFLEETDVNLRLHERGWSLVYRPEAEVHHKHLENSVRYSDGTPRSLYRVGRSKAYFAWVHGRGHYPQDLILARVAADRARRRRRLLLLRLQRRISRAAAEQLLSEFDRGVDDGRQTAQRAKTGRSALEELPAKAGGTGFRPFAPTRPTAYRMRVCFLLNSAAHDMADERSSGLYRAACALAGRGHEVTAICLAPGRRASIDFGAQLWLHRVTETRPFGLGRVSKVNGWERLGAAARREIARIQARRQFQAVATSLDGVEALARLNDLQLPQVAVRLTDGIDVIESTLAQAVAGTGPAYQARTQGFGA